MAIAMTDLPILTCITARSTDFDGLLMPNRGDHCAPNRGLRTRREFGLSLPFWASQTMLIVRLLM
jgi:hypothetical protein